MPPNCNEHRKGLELLALKMQIEKGIQYPVMREEIQKRIDELEKELKLN